MRQFASCVRVGILLGLATGWSAASARADPVLLDQVNVGTRVGGIGIQGTEIAQTLTVGISGVLTEVDLGVFNPNPGSMTFPDPLSIQIQRTAAGLPTGTAVQSITVPIGSVTTDRFALTSFGGLNVDVQAGEVLAIVLTTGANGNYGWSTACCYSGGDMFVSRGSGFTPIFPNTSAVPADFMFRTFVDPSLSTTATPEPQGLLLLASGLTVALIARFRRRTLASDL